MPLIFKTGYLGDVASVILIWILILSFYLHYLYLQNFICKYVKKIIQIELEQIQDYIINAEVLTLSVCYLFTLKLKAVFWGTRKIIK